MDEWTGITRAGAAVALVLSAGNTIKLILEARRHHREDLEKKVKEAARKEAENQLAFIVQELQKPEHVGLTASLQSEYRSGAELGLAIGVLRGGWQNGQLEVRLAYRGDLP